VYYQTNASFVFNNKIFHVRRRSEKLRTIRKITSGQQHSNNTGIGKTHTAFTSTILKQLQSSPFIGGIQHVFDEASGLYVLYGFSSEDGVELISSKLFDPTGDVTMSDVTDAKEGKLSFPLTQRVTEDVARFYIAEIILAIGHLHELGLVYGYQQSSHRRL